MTDLTTLLEQATAPLEQGLVVLFPAAVLRAAPAHRHGPLAALEHELRGRVTGMGQIIARSLACVDLVAVVFTDAYRHNLGGNPGVLDKRLSAVQQQGPDSDVGRKLLADTHPLPGTDLHVLDVTDDLAAAA